MQAVLASTRPPGRRVLRFFGASESAVAQALAEAGGDGDGVEATICARDFEIHVDLVVEPGAEPRGDELAAALRDPLERYLFSEDERSIAEIVLELCRARGLTLATAESCTGGMVAARLTDVPGSSDVVRGGIVAYANEVKIAELGVPEDVLVDAWRRVGRGRRGDGGRRARAARHRRRDRRDGRRRAWRRQRGRSLSGSSTSTSRRRASRRAGEFSLPGDRDTIRARATVAALHLVRAVLTRSRHQDE